MIESVRIDSVDGRLRLDGSLRRASGHEVGLLRRRTISPDTSCSHPSVKICSQLGTYMTVRWVSPRRFQIARSVASATAVGTPDSSPCSGRFPFYWYESVFGLLNRAPPRLASGREVASLRRQIVSGPRQPARTSPSRVSSDAWTLPDCVRTPTPSFRRAVTLMPTTCPHRSGSRFFCRFWSASHSPPPLR